MDKILEALKDYIRVNEVDKSIEVYDEFGVHIKIFLDDVTLEEFKKQFPSW